MNTPVSPNPVLVEESRGQHRENFHRGAAVVVDAKGHIIHAWGDVNRPIYGRSSVKLLQAIPLVESGAADKWSLNEEEIALACASHNGEAIHTETAEKWMRKIGLTEKALECGIHRPVNREVARALSASKKKPTAFHNACSGKHLGFLTSSLFYGEHPQGYTQPQHGVQKRISRVLEEMMGVSLEKAPHGTDGCNIPTYAVPLMNLAWGMARIANPEGLPMGRQKAIHRIVTAIQHHPDYIQGEKGFDTNVIRLTKGDVLSKMGAGGIQVAAVLSKGWGIALKIDDGEARSAELAMTSLLNSLGLLDRAALEDKVPLLSHTQQTVGFLKATGALKV